MIEPLRVLIVEDEALILMQLEGLVEDAGHHVVGTAMRSAAAISLAREVKPDLALVDLNLGDGDSGLIVAQALRTMDGVMIVFVTANPLRLDGDWSGAAGVIAKPFSRTVITRTMSYFEERIKHPPPRSSPPNGLQLPPEYRPPPTAGVARSV